MANVKSSLLAGVAASMRDRNPLVHGETAGTVHGEPRASVPSSMVRQSEGRRRLDSACVIRVDRIIADPAQPRREFDPDALARLAESLKARGQLQPIRVRWEDASDRYVVVVGERRWRAAQLAGLETLACVVVTGPASSTDLLEDQLVENCLREDLKPIEQARAFKALLDARELTVRALAERLQIGHASISRALALLGLPEEVQESVERGEIAPNTAYELSKVDDPAEQVTLAKEAARGRLKRDEAKAKVSRPKKGRGARKITSHVFRSPAGRVTAELRKGEGLEALLDLVEAAASDIRTQLEGKAAA